MGYVLKEKLKYLKVALKEWNKVEYCKMEDNIKTLISRIRELDLSGENSLLTSQDVEERRSLFGDLWRLLKSKEVLAVQRSRVKWNIDGDANTKFFHGCMKLRQQRNVLVCLRVGDRWLDTSTEIVAEVTNYFINHFSSNTWLRPKLDGVIFPSISDGENLMLSAPFVFKEIEEVALKSDGNNSPGPDGFNFAFVKSFWPILKREVCIMFDQFHGNARLSKGLLSFFITLIPKVVRPSTLGDFRPISLLGCLYKLIAKVLPARLAKVMDSVVANGSYLNLGGY
jgi:hypothetical protein